MEIDDEVFRAAKLRALDTRKTLRQVVDEALRSWLRGEVAAPRSEASQRLDRITKILSEVDALPVLDDRDPSAILGYDDRGTFG